MSGFPSGKAPIPPNDPLLRLPMSTLATRTVDYLLRQRWPLLALAIVLALLAWQPASRLQLDRSIETMFPADDPTLLSFLKLKRTFGGNEIVLAVYPDQDLFAEDASGIRRLTLIRQRLERVPGVKDVLSIDRILGEAIVQTDNDLARRQRELFAGYTHNRAGDVASLAVMLIPRGETDVPRRETIAAMREVMADVPGGRLTGEPVMISDGFRYVEHDGQRLGWSSTLLLSLVILFCFRSVRWMLIPLAVVQLSLLLTRASIVTSGLQLSMVSSMLTAIVTVVGVAAVIHVIVRYRDALDHEPSSLPAFRTALLLLAAPMFWACTTDAVGFGSLLVAEVAPVRDFGIMTAIGALAVLVSIALLVPGLAMLPGHDAQPRQMWGQGWMERRLFMLVGWVDRKPWWLAAAALAIAVLGVVGTLRLEVESDFTKNFRAHSPIVESYVYVEENLGGAGVWDVMLPAEDALTWTYLKKVYHLEQRLQQEVTVPGPDGQPVPALTKTLSLADAIVEGSPVDIDQMPLAMLRNATARTGLAAMQGKIPVFYDALYHQDPADGQHYFRIMLRAKERQPSHVKKEVIRQVEQIVAEEFPEGQVTGFYVLLAGLIDSILRDQWLAFAVACVGVLLMMILALRSLPLALAALIPNALPILVVLGSFGWLQLLGFSEFKINMGAAMIAAVSMGLSIDSTIHYLTAFRRARAAGRTTLAAIGEAQQGVGRAVVLSTVALVVGFLSMAMSNFIPTIYFGLLTGLTMLGGLAGNLLLLPLLLWAVGGGAGLPPDDDNVD